MVSWAACAGIARAALAGKWLYRPSERPEASKPFFNLRPLALSYLRTKKPWTKVGSVIYQTNETGLSFLKSTNRMGLQTDAGFVFVYFP